MLTEVFGPKTQCRTGHCGLRPELTSDWGIAVDADYPMSPLVVEGGDGDAAKTGVYISEDIPAECWRPWPSMISLLFVILLGQQCMAREEKGARTRNLRRVCCGR